jgi:putative DNA primase/helicase
VDEIHDFFDKMLQGPDASDETTNGSAPQYSDEELALRFAEKHAQDMRYVDKWGRWMIWDGQRWRVDETREAINRARGVARAAAQEIVAARLKPGFARTTASAARVTAIESLSRADPRMASRVEDWDADAWLLNTPEGTVDLRSGKLRPHARDDHLTKMTSVAPGGDCLLWLSFLDKVLQGDRELIGFVQRMLGYSLTGSIRDHALFFLYGTGGNGKGVLLNTWREIMGDYCCVASMETFVARNTDRHPTDLAMLRGARSVIAQETEEGQRWAEARIKQMTGGDPISARFMRQDFFTFEPTFKLMIAGNHKPALRNFDEAVQRRFHLVPLTVTIPKSERDPTLPEKLQPEHPGILAWTIQGCLAWQEFGLAPPSAVRAATEDYLADEDAIGRFLDECCETGESLQRSEVQDLFASWRAWCEQTNEFAGNIKRFSQNVESRGFRRDKDPKSRRSCFYGIYLKSNAPRP